MKTPLFICAAATLGLLLTSPVHAKGKNSPTSLRAAIEDLQMKYGDRYPQAKAYLKELDQKANQSGENFQKLQQRALRAHPLLTNTPVLFVERAQYLSDHHNTETIFQTDEVCTHKYRPSGPMKLLDVATGKTKVLLDPGKDGSIRDPEVHPDGTRVIFSMRKNIQDDYHIYEISSKGSGLKQLTSAKGVADFDPCYLPDGSIVFSSTREPKFCGCNRHIMANLFRMEADGANIHQIGKSTLFEGQSSVMPDGRILYNRWEYVDRNFGDAQGLWTVNPDGTNHAVYWGNNTASPGGVLDARMIPGTNLTLCTFSSCHDVPWGAMAIIDRNLGVDGRKSVVRTWPADAINLVDKGNFDTFKRVNPKYEDPFPLSETTFLVSRMTQTKGKKGRPMGIFLVDTFGNEILLHSEGRGCYEPMPVTTSKPAPVKPITRDYKPNGTGTFYVQNVYIGTHMQGVAPGEIKYLRVVEAPEKRTWINNPWSGQGTQWPAMNWHNFQNKRILGTVPVEEDGSVHFECPADTFVFFQLLDKDKMMIHSMRSGTSIQSGETQGCVGCHEDRNSAVPLNTQKQPLAMKRAASKLSGWKGKPREFSYQGEVQPVFDQHCVSCHDYGKPAGQKLNLASDRTLVFNASYIDLWSKGYVNAIGAGPAAIQQARSWGAANSRLVKALTVDHQNIPEHKDVRLKRDELEKITTWLDLNAPYYPTFQSAHPEGLAGRSPLTPAEVGKLGKLTKTRFVTGHNHRQGAQISFERPELSPCLSKLDPKSKEYRVALALINEGKKRLTQTPRGDMPGFKPSDRDLKRLKKYTDRKKIEEANRKAIQEGNKRYDRDFQ
ncbi:PD40 domain-containing protein [Verrucomicrobiaceae bacterium N1E253]|uniref:PD40 domain-containing protein n=1 Tax=Oceaniferula marina TaxID=2748318 RepID=A0A851GP46_9BACT|nr:PD40 domain-containing protein [Oceaniferula marina]NWK56600.1 PD40 domain-containing protein [Oceaniferula marina]